VRLAEFRDHPGYAEMVNEVASAMRFSDPERAKAWIAALDDALRGRAARDFASGGPVESLPEMLDWMGTVGVADEGPGGGHGVGGIVDRLAAEPGDERCGRTLGAR
jgi:hypothetical protein